MHIIFVTGGYKIDRPNIDIGSLMLATVLSKKEYNVQVIDLDYYHLYVNNSLPLDYSLENLQDEVQYIVSFKPDVVCFYGISTTYHYMLLLAKRIKETDNNIMITFGGPHASLTARRSLEEFSWIDAIGIGEGENTIEDILNAVCGNGCFKKIKGVAYRSNGRVNINAENALIEDLDELPFIDYSLVDYSKYFDASIYLRIEGGRGCPYACTFCSTKTFWKRKTRLISPERLIEEIKYIKDKYNINNFSIVHDLFTVNKNHVLKFAQALIDEKMNISWRCSSRIDTIDEETIALMKQSGCHDIYFGVETGSQRMQYIINKNLKVNDIVTVLDLLQKYGIDAQVSLMYGFPDETINDIRHTLEIFRICIEKRIRLVQLHLMGVLPGTEVYNNVKHELYLSPNLSDIAAPVQIDECRLLIKENPDIFPQYYTFKSEIRDRLKGLDIFFYKYPRLLYTFFRDTYKLLMLYYDNSYLDWFIDFQKYNYEDINKLSIYEDDFYRIKEKRTEIFDSVASYIKKCSFGKYKNMIQEMFRFEQDILNFRINQNTSYKIYSYECDVYSIKASGYNMTEDYNRIIRLQFMKKGDKFTVENVGDSN